MKSQTEKKLEIFLLLAVRKAARRSSDSAMFAETEKADAAQSEIESAEAENQKLFAFAEQLNAAEAEKFERLRLGYQKKPDDEKQKWRERVAISIGADESGFIDECVHRSRVEAALEREIPAIQKIIARSLSFDDENNSPANFKESAIDRAETRSASVSARLEKTVRRAFAAQFVALADLPSASAFDRLSGAQLARLVRFAGIREVAFACAGIKAVEAVAGFLRRFEPEDARAVAAQLSGLPKISDEQRLAFAENLVGSALEIEPKPSSAMLDWLGIRLVGILLCAPQKAESESAARAVYAEQKLPLETEPKLFDVIDTVCRTTPDKLRGKIAAEIEQLAETVSGSSGKR